MAKFYYQTIEIPKELLLQYENKSKIDEDMIYYMICQTDGLTKSEIHEIYSRYNIKISESSISRSLTNLTDKNKLIKTNEKRIGKWKKNNYVYSKVTESNIEEAKLIWKNKEKNFRLKRFQIKLILSSINYVFDNKTDLQTNHSKELKTIFKKLNQI